MDGSGLDTTGAGGSAAGDTGTSLRLAALGGVGLGRYSAPGWPQPLSARLSATVPAPVYKRKVDFTIKSWIEIDMGV